MRNQLPDDPQTSPNPQSAGTTDAVLAARPILERFGLAGRTALVTGAGQGIGRALAFALGQAGAAVAVADIAGDKAAAVAGELRAHGITALPIQADVTDPAAVNAMITSVREAWGTLTIAVNNAGVGTTNGHGTLLLPSLLPYYGNTVALVTEDIPVDRSLEAITKLAVPPLHGGALVEFRAPRVRGLQGTIHPTVPDLPTDFGPGAISLTVNDKPIEAVVGRHGEFYLEDIPPAPRALLEAPAAAQRPAITAHLAGSNRSMSRPPPTI